MIYFGSVFPQFKRGLKNLGSKCPANKLIYFCISVQAVAEGQVKVGATKKARVTMVDGEVEVEE